MDIKGMYQTITYPTAFHFKEYIHPRQYLDPKKQMLDRARQQKNKKHKQGKFKATTKHKPCFMDQFIKPIKDYPSPLKYKTQKSLGKRYKSASLLNKINPSLNKKTYIDDIQFNQNKFKHPGVGKYNLLEKPIKPKTTRHRIEQKISHMDNVDTLAAGVPGPGSHNPHIQVTKLKMNRTDYKFFQQKHAQQQKQLKRSISTKLGPTTYTPVKYDTFESFALHKKQMVSRWSHGDIDKRRGARSNMKIPSPAQYNLINQWTKPINPKQPLQGSVKLFDKFTKSARQFDVYH